MNDDDELFVTQETEEGPARQAGAQETARYFRIGMRLAVAERGPAAIRGPLPPTTADLSLPLG